MSSRGFGTAEEGGDRAGRGQVIGDRFGKAVDEARMPAFPAGAFVTFFASAVSRWLSFCSLSFSFANASCSWRNCLSAMPGCEWGCFPRPCPFGSWPRPLPFGEGETFGQCPHDPQKLSFLRLQSACAACDSTPVCGIWACTESARARPRACALVLNGAERERDAASCNTNYYFVYMW